MCIESTKMDVITSLLRLGRIITVDASECPEWFGMVFVNDIGAG